MPSSKKPMNPRNPRKPKSPILGFIVLLCNGSFLKDVFTKIPFLNNLINMFIKTKDNASLVDVILNTSK